MPGKWSRSCRGKKTARGGKVSEDDVAESTHEGQSVFGDTAESSRRGCNCWEVGLHSYFGSVTLYHFVFGDSEGWVGKRYTGVEH